MARTSSFTPEAVAILQDPPQGGATGGLNSQNRVFGDSKLNTIIPTSIYFAFLVFIVFFSFGGGGGVQSRLEGVQGFQA